MIYLEINQDNVKRPADAVIHCIEESRKGILLDEASTPEDFFDLSSGLLGELLHKLSIYQLPLAMVIFRPEKYSKNFNLFWQKPTGEMSFDPLTTGSKPRPGCKNINFLDEIQIITL